MIETIRFWSIMVLIALGIFFTFVSAVGVIRLPDVYARAHTASQTDTLGAGMALAAVALALGYQNAAIYTVLLLFFVFITNPTAAHAIARSAAESGIEPWEASADGAVGAGGAGEVLGSADEPTSPDSETVMDKAAATAEERDTAEDSAAEDQTGEPGAAENGPAEDSAAEDGAFENGGDGR